MKKWMAALLLILFLSSESCTLRMAPNGPTLRFCHPARSYRCSQQHQGSDM